MKKLLMALMLAGGACFAFAGDNAAPAPWEATLAKVKNLTADTGIAGFCRKEAPDYITGNFAEADRPAKPEAGKVYDLSEAPKFANRNGFWVVNPAQAETYHAKLGDWVGGYFDGNGAFVKGHAVNVLGGLPYGIGQLIMIPLCLVIFSAAGSAVFTDGIPSRY